MSSLNDEVDAAFAGVLKTLDNIGDMLKEHQETVSTTEVPLNIETLLRYTDNAIQLRSSIRLLQEQTKQMEKAKFTQSEIRALILGNQAFMNEVAQKIEELTSAYRQSGMEISSAKSRAEKLEGDLTEARETVTKLTERLRSAETEAVNESRRMVEEKTENLRLLSARGTAIKESSTERDRADQLAIELAISKSESTKLSGDLQIATTRINTVSQQLSVVQEESVRLRSACDNANGALSAERAWADQPIQNLIDLNSSSAKGSENLENASSRIDILLERLSTVQKQNSVLRTARDTSIGACSAEKSRGDRLFQELINSKSTSAKLSRDLQIATAEMSTINEQLERTQDENSQLHGARDRNLESFSAEKSRAIRLDQELTTANEKIGQLTTQLEDLKAAAIASADKQRRLENMKSERDSARTHRDTLKEDNAVVRARNSDLEKAISDLKVQNNSAKDRLIARLDVANQQSTSDRKKVIQVDQNLVKSKAMHEAAIQRIKELETALDKSQADVLATVNQLSHRFDTIVQRNASGHTIEEMFEDLAKRLTNLTVEKEEIGDLKTRIQRLETSIQYQAVENQREIGDLQVQLNNERMFNHPARDVLEHAEM